MDQPTESESNLANLLMLMMVIVAAVLVGNPMIQVGWQYLLEMLNGMSSSGAAAPPVHSPFQTP